MTFLKKIFSVKNEDCHKILTCFGIRFKIKSKTRCLIKSVECLREDIHKLENLNLSSFVSRTGLSRVQKKSAKNNFLLMNYAHLGSCLGTNIGDNVQTIALKNALMTLFPDSCFSYWDRDNLLNYDGEPAYCVYQGWFSENTTDFLPSSQICPVFLGTHFGGEARKMIAFLHGRTVLFRNQEIGCRDLSTKNFCESLGINSYFSRCLTLTLPVSAAEKKEKVCLVNVPEEWEQYIPEPMMRHAIRINQKDVTIDDYPTQQSRTEYAEKLLQTYASSSCVITTAIHCAMPCVAMGIPVVLIDDVQWNIPALDRFSAARGILNPVSFHDLQERKVDFSPKTIDIAPLKKMLLENLKLSVLQAQGESVDSLYLNALRQRIADFHVS